MAIGTSGPRSHASRLRVVEGRNRVDAVAATLATLGSISIAYTALVMTGQIDATENGDAATWLLLEPLTLSAMVFVVVRWASPASAVACGVIAAAGASMWVQRFLPDEPVLGAAAASAVWLIPSLAAGTVAWYLRWAASERARAIAMARTEQRTRLAVDLHDFVAHDISEIVARAQAGLAVLPLGDPRVVELVEQIEAAGLRALESMDQTVRALDAREGPLRLTRGGIDDIDALVRRFAAAGDTRATVTTRLTGEVDAAIGAEAYRAVVEALTNVRRHASHATDVVVTLDEADDRLLVSISDDGDGEPARSRRAVAGLGLAAMTERVRHLGGTVEAGPRPAQGWRVSVDLPLRCNTDKGVNA